MDYKEGTGTSNSSNHAMSGANKAGVGEEDKAVPSSPKLECYDCGMEFESEEELNLHVKRQSW